MKKPVFSVLLLVIFILFQPVHAENNEFPGRKIYPGTAIIELNQLKEQFDQFVIVDVRSDYEYQTLRIIGSHNIPLASRKFSNELRNLMQANPSKKIVFYCNGKTCMKSYKAEIKSRKHGINNALAFDAGVMDWAKAYPQLSVLLGRSPIDPSRLISKENFEKHLLDTEQFIKRGSMDQSIVLDVRDRFQRDGLTLFVGKEIHLNLDDVVTLNKYIDKAKSENKTLLVYDASGKQVQWLMYYLEDVGLTSYYFLKGGVRDYYKHLKQNLPVSK